MIVRRWPPWFKALYGGEWPRKYLTFDVETTGFKRDRDVIVEMGHCLVENGKPVSRLNIVLDWSNHKVVPVDYVKRKLIEVRDGMARDGRQWGMTFQRMQDEGIQPEKALSFYRELLGDWASDGGVFALHNGFFDEEMLTHNFAGFDIDPEGFSFPENQYFDTSSIERANQVSDNTALPMERESMKGYFKRLKHLKGNTLHSSLDKHCWHKYGWGSKDGLVKDQCHGAGFDAFLVHLLMEEFGEQSKQLPIETKVAPAAEFLERAANDSAKSHKAVMTQIIRRRGQRNR
jgi:DNA polymerase III epsilon subunit-like protein